MSKSQSRRSYRLVRAMQRLECSGQMTIVICVALVVLMGAAALGCDVAVFYINWSELQRGADAAALAGAGYLPLDPATAVTSAVSYADMNGIAPSEIISTQVSTDQKSLSITLARPVNYYFGRALGLSATTVTATATATAETVGAVTGVLPFGIAYQTTYSPGQLITLMAGQVGAGNWSSLALGGTGASIYQQNIEGGYSSSIATGQLVTTETGLISGPTQQGIDYRINEGLDLDPSGTYASHSLTDPRAVVVPMVNFSDINGQSQVPVVGFAELWLVGVDGGGNIQTYFIGQAVPGSIPNPLANNFGAYVPVLTQ